MSKQNKNYVVYELSEQYTYTREVDPRTPKWSWDKRKFTGYSWEGRLYSRDQLVNACANSLGTKSSILDNISKDMKETSLEYVVDDSGNSFVWRTGYYKRIFYIGRVSGGVIKSVDLTVLRKEAEKRKTELDSKRESRKWWHKYWIDYDKLEFRKDPVPYTSYRNHVGRGHGCVHSGLKKYISDNTDPEYKEYSSPKFQNPQKMDRWDWDGTLRYCGNRNWKNQYKVRHQWEVHTRKKVDVSHYDRRDVSIEEELDLIRDVEN